MDIYTILIYLLSGLSIILGISLVYLLIKEPKEILYGILRGMKDTGRFETNLLFSPIWVPAFVLDKYFKLGIYKPDEEGTNQDDVVYESVAKLDIDFSQYQKYIIVNQSNLMELNNAIAECYETTPEEDFKGICYHCTQDQFILEIRDNCNFYNYHYLIQWLNNELISNKNIEIYGLALNESNPMLSYYVVNDKTGQHINSLTGKTFGGDVFSVNLLEDYEKKQWLDINNKIKIDREIEMNSITTDFSNLEFIEFS